MKKPPVITPGIFLPNITKFVVTDAFSPSNSEGLIF